MRTVSIDAARRIALGAQGFNGGRPQGRIDVRHFRRVMETVGLVQLDSVNVCVRSHYMPFYSRLGPYDRVALDRWLNESGENFEYWAHAAAVLPVDRYSRWRWKMRERIVWRQAEALLDAHPKLLGDVRRQVYESGPLTVRDLDAPNQRNEPWWGYGPGKVALELLFGNGEVAALRTKNFTRLYDAPERMIDAAAREAPALSKEEAYPVLLRDAVRHQGIGTVHDIADYFRLNMSRSAPILAQMASTGEIEEVEVRGWDAPTYLDPEAVRPRTIQGATLLSPFDPVTWYRERAERLFDFEYRIEIYVPEPKRVYGYYTLPFMLDGDLVGRVDLKADRKSGTLLVQSAWREEGTSLQRVADAMATELESFAAWLDLGDINIGEKGNVATELRRSM
jgi:uncharacterized protein YcaQ